MKEKYDYIVIGSGPAGHVSAIKAAQLGLSVAVVEKNDRMLGGVCLNEGCIPAKSLYHSAGVYDIIKSAALHGFDVQCGPLNLGKFVQKSRETAEVLRNGLLFLFKKNKIDFITGTASFLDKNTIEISGSGTTALKGDKFLIATGSFPRELPGFSFDGRHILNSSHAIRTDRVPDSIVIAGGGAIGIEFASFFSALGTKVHVIEALASILPAEDRDISNRMRSILKHRGVQIDTSTVIRDIITNGEETRVFPENREDPIVCDFVLACVGRLPDAKNLKLENAGIETDENGFIPVNDSFMTKIPNIYAAGDVIRTPMLAHVASAEGEAAAIAAAGRVPDVIDYTSIPNAIYSSVQVSSVGYTEEAAKNSGLDYSAGKNFFKSNGKAIADGHTEGIIKVIAQNSTRKIIGAHIICHNASDLIAEFVLAKKNGLTTDDISGSVHAHPTFSETAVDACRSVFGKPIHS
ncbi:MAG: dihydrolipoyl dehydrogenase [Candidatus Omnitrophota bacterium]